MKTLSIPVEMYVGGETVDVTAEVEFSYSPGYPGSRPSFSDPGSPPEPPEVEVRKVTLVINDKHRLDGTTKIIREDAPGWLIGVIANSDELYRQMCDEGEEAGKPDPDAAYEARRDEDRFESRAIHDDPF